MIMQSIILWRCNKDMTQKEKIIKEIVEIKWKIGASENQNGDGILQLKDRLHDLISEIIKIEHCGQ